jgi:hypothetical protein
VSEAVGVLPSSNRGHLEPNPKSLPDTNGTVGDANSLTKTTKLRCHGNAFTNPSAAANQGSAKVFEESHVDLESPIYGDMTAMVRHRSLTIEW